MMVLSDGRHFGWLERVDPDGVPVLVFHGTAGSSFQLMARDDNVRSAGIRLVYPHRLGYEE